MPCASAATGTPRLRWWLGVNAAASPMEWGAGALVPLGTPLLGVQMSQAGLEHGDGQGGQSWKLLGEEAQGAAPSRAKQGIWRSMILSAESRREKQPAVGKLAGTFGGKSVILEQLTIKEHSPATIFHPNYSSDPPLRHLRCVFIHKVNTQIPSPSHKHCGFWTDPPARGLGSTTAAPEIPQITRKILTAGVNRIAVVWFNMNVFMYC